MTTEHSQSLPDEGHDAAHHVVPASAFLGVLIALLVLTVITVVVSRFDFGNANMLVAMAIAAVKASLVMAVFMHLRWDTAINNIAILSSIIFLSLLFIFVLADIATRGDAEPIHQIHDNQLPETFDWKSGGH